MKMIYMKMRKFSVIFLVAFMWVVSATFISITTTVSLDKILGGNETLANLTIVNSGDEPAYDVLVSLILPDGLNSNDLFPGELNPGKPYTGEFKIGVGENVVPGKYTAGVVTDYKDANGYPFSAVSTFSMIIKKPTVSRVVARIPEITLGDKETRDLRFSIKNLDDKPHQVEVKLFLPRELKSDNEKKTVAVDSKSDREVSFTISSFGALPGSNYVVFALIDYEEEGLYYSSSSGGVVHVVEQKGGVPPWIPIAVVALLILIFILYQFRK